MIFLKVFFTITINYSENKSQVKEKVILVQLIQMEKK